MSQLVEAGDDGRLDSSGLIGLRGSGLGYQSTAITKTLSLIHDGSAHRL